MLRFPTPTTLFCFAKHGRFFLAENWERNKAICFFRGAGNRTRAFKFFMKISTTVPRTVGEALRRGAGNRTRAARSQTEYTTTMLHPDGTLLPKP